MNFKTYLEKKSKLLVIWFTIHGSALFLNLFGIRGEIIDKPGLEITLFTRGTPDTKDFWPFVKFYSNYSYQYSIGDINSYNVFSGIFYDYDFSEFIAYSVIIFLVLYFSFIQNQKKTTLK